MERMMTEVKTIPADHPLNLAMFKWDPAQHPRDIFGKFKEKLASMSNGDGIVTPDGVRVTRKKSGFVVNAKGEATEVKDIANAADMALDKDRKTKYKSRISTVAKAIRPFVDAFIKSREEEKRFAANVDMLGHAAVALGATLAADKKTDYAKALFKFMGDSYTASKAKSNAAAEREVASWIVDKVFSKLEGLSASADQMEFADLNLSAWYEV